MNGSSFLLKTDERGNVRGLKSAARGVLFSVVAAVSCASLTLPVHGQQSLKTELQAQIIPDAEMLLESDQITYDFDRDLIVASGGVQIFYDGYTVDAHQIVYDRRKGELKARGEVVMTEPTGNVVRTNELTLSEDFANGFANALQLDTPQRTRFIADKATRSDGNVTTFDNALYTVYTRPTNPPNKPPLWRIRAAKIIHDQKEKVIYYENASLEFFGAPVAYLPYMSMPDPTVKRKSGFLIPTGVANDRLGFGASIPYYWALDPHYDLTTTLTPLSKQGAVADFKFRHQLANGGYTFAAAGLFQARPSEFSGSSGDRRWRGAINTTGNFNLSENWKAGWDLTYKSDRAFLKDYSFVSFNDDDETSEAYLSGNTLRNGFSVKGYAFSIFQEDYTNPTYDAPGFSPIGQSLQDKQPFVAPVVDYNFVFDDPIGGGELSFDSNFTSLTRAKTDAFRASGVDRFRGVDGTFSRMSMQTNWRRTFIDPIGQSFTPFAYVRGDLFFNASADPNVNALTGDAIAGRAMPAAGLEYRYPFIATFQGGNQILEPVAQVIVRPDEQSIGELPNEDAQSIVFDATTLFEWDKFSGFDRAEGGSRLNVGLNYKLQLDRGYYMSALFGRSYQLGGKNSYATPDILGATLDSGLASSQSDYVSSLYLNTNHGIRVGAQARLDEDDLSFRRFQAQATARYGPLSSSLAYAFLSAQPNLGIPDPREEILSSASLRLEDNWRVFGLLRYDLENSDVVQDGIGAGYDDEGFSLSLSYAEDRSRNDGDKVNRTFYMRIGLRTIGNTQISSGLSD